MKWTIAYCLSLTLAGGKLTNSFVVEIDGKDGDDQERMAKDIADRHGFEFIEKVIGNIYHFRYRRLKRSVGGDFEQIEYSKEGILSEPFVIGIDQQTAKRRSKRDLLDIDLTPNDALFGEMWYINPDYPRRNDDQRSEDDIRHMNVTGAWALGYTGAGVVVTLLDDGIEWDHPDLRKNYDGPASKDINGKDDNPMPRYNKDNEEIDFKNKKNYKNPERPYRLTEDVINYKKETNRHGTRCAGEVSGEFGNGICVPGIAYNAGIGGIRMLDGDVTDLVEGLSIGHNPDHVDIYSASWGPDDDGETVDGPDRAAREAFRLGALNGRQGKGSIFVWASGNGGRYQDNCNCDGYTNSIYTISISSTSEKETVPWYSEACASTLASTYSSGGSSEKQIVTTDLRHICTKSHTGTSASAPIAAAILALTLEANPNLTWRDMQHLIVHTSKQRRLQTTDWATNGVGRHYSHHYGYGLMDAGALVSLAKDWVTIPEQRKCTTPIISKARSILMDSKVYEEAFHLRPDCSSSISIMEHVIATLTLSFKRRGDLRIMLISPSGTISNILDKRPHDNSGQGFNDFDFLTVHMWDEPTSLGPENPWRLRVENLGSAIVGGTISSFKLTIHGTGKDQYKADCKLDNVYDSSQGRCLAACPLGTFRQSIDINVTEFTSAMYMDVRKMDQCVQCDPACLICSGPADGDCVSHRPKSSSRLLRNPGSVFVTFVLYLVFV